MPTKPRPIVVHCEKCGWKRTYAPISDALIERIPDTCPECGSTKLKKGPASIIDTALSGLDVFFQKA
jgi:predicted nucleic-acid-binding Zn-ribbon protein